MTKNKAQEYIQAHLNENDSLIGFFQATKYPSIWLYLLIGPFAFFNLKVYFLAVTEKGIHFHKLNLLEKFVANDFFKFNEIERVKISKGFFQSPMFFKFKNGRKLKLKAQRKGVGKLATITENVQQHIERNVSLAP